MNPAGLVCDRRLLQRYIRESFELEERVSSCGMLPLLQQPVRLPLVAAQQEMREGCPSVLLQQLFEKGSFFVLQLQSFRWQYVPDGSFCHLKSCNQWREQSHALLHKRSEGHSTDRRETNSCP
ncbi:hypothetical protein JRQ81_017735 [Phrynocephalus forsythii]|uniref:Uncharacterized protein n=1 Tax=Phrynocephalus forsythii TaxID=171643 RepID=A0A9Q1B0S9_9SAUR|nr:hypothetical protein JRQ81_017735 [Phrynocephalus forsythii]